MNPAPRPSVVSVRQAVCDASRAVIGYEVLTGDPDAPPASARFCARALLEAFTDVDLDLVAPHHPAYLTVAPALLLRLDMLPVSPDRVVLQVETAATVHEEVVAAVVAPGRVRLRLRRRRSAVARRAVAPARDRDRAARHGRHLPDRRRQGGSGPSSPPGWRCTPWASSPSRSSRPASMPAATPSRAPSARCPRSTRRPPSSSARWPPPASCSRPTSTARASRRSSPATSSSATACCATPTRPSSSAGARSARCARRSRSSASA